MARKVKKTENRKSIKPSIQKQLLVVSNNSCCFPGCNNPLLYVENETRTLVGDFCHIKAIKHGGARFDPKLQKDFVNSYDNLLMMCKNHHKVIDDNENVYTNDVLKKCKSDHESKTNRMRVAKEKSEKLNDQEFHQAIDNFLKEKESAKNLPKKNPYDQVKNYIERTCSEIEADDIPNTLLNYILDKKTNHISLLSVAATGKSVELDNLANYFSSEESEFFPFKIRLKTLTDQSIKDFIKHEYPNFECVPKNKMIFLLDALDEVHVNYVDIAANNISNFAKEFKSSKIVVSCRNNLYITENSKRSAKLEGFKTFYLNPLNYSDINNYIRKNANGSDFIAKIESSGLYDLLESPFYLTNLVEFYNKNDKNIPRSKKEIFETLVTERIDYDLNKFNNSGLDLQLDKNKIEKKIQQLAFTMQCLGRNYLDEQDEFFQIVDDREILKRIHRTFLFNKNKENVWEFEHNNFQEYLAAKYISSFELEKIKEIISFPGKTKIKPNWLNTLSFLFSIIDTNNFTQLLTWLNEVEPDCLVRFEKDRITPELREHIFKTLYQYYDERKIRVGNEKFHIVDLTKFVSDSNSIIEFIIDKISSSSNLLFNEKILTLTHFENINKYSNKIKDVLLTKILDPSISNENKYYCLNAMGELKIIDDDTTEILVKNLDLEKSKYVRAGFYRYIINSNSPDKYTDILINGIDKAERYDVAIARDPMSDIEDDIDDREDNISFSNEKNSLYKVIIKLDDLNSIKKLFSYFTNSIKKFENYNNLLLNKAVILYNKGHEELFDKVLALLNKSIKRFDRNVGDPFRVFFERTNTMNKAFHLYYDQMNQEETVSYEVMAGLTVVTNDDTLKLLLDNIRNGKLSDQKIFQLRYGYGQFRPTEYYERFYSSICEINAKYKYQDNDLDARKAQRRKRNLELLFNQQEFLKEVGLIFESIGKEILTNSELAHYETENYSNLTNTIVIRKLRTLAADDESEKSVTLKEITSYINNENRWLWYKLHQLVNYDSRSNEYEFGSVEHGFITAWVMENIKTADFSTAIEVKDKENYIYRNTEAFIIYFSERLELELKKENYLDFLYLESDIGIIPFKHSDDLKNAEDRLISDFVLAKVGMDETKRRILEILKLPQTYWRVKKQLMKFCNKHGITEASEYIFSEINSLGSSFSDYQKRELIEWYVNLNGDLIQLESILDSLHEDLQMFIVEILIENKSENIETLCEKFLLANFDKETELFYLKCLLNIDHGKHFVKLKDWILKHKRIPEIRFDFATENAFHYLIEVYEDCLNNNYGNNRMRNNKGTLLDQAIRIGAQSEDKYNHTKAKINLWIKNYKEMEYLNYYIEKLDQMYYSNKPHSMTLKEIKVLLQNN